MMPATREISLTREEQRSKLLHLAATMLHSTTGPSTYLADHEHLPKRIPARWWRWMCGKLQDAEDERRRWAIQLREVYDSMSAADKDSDS